MSIRRDDGWRREQWRAWKRQERLELAQEIATGMVIRLAQAVFIGVLFGIVWAVARAVAGFLTI